jgi:hypothetical protein
MGIHVVKESEKNNSIYPNVLKSYKNETNRWLSGVEATNGYLPEFTHASQLAVRNRRWR